MVEERIAEKGSSGLHLEQPTAQTKSPRPCFPGSHPGLFEYLHNLPEQAVPELSHSYNKAVLLDI